jgi:CBS domain-containing protein
MYAEGLISPLIPKLQPTDSGSTALHLMDELHVTALPLVQDDQYMGLIQESDLLDWDMPETPIGSASFHSYRPMVGGNVHPYEALRISHQQNLDIVPVVNDANNYIGSITRDDLLKFFAESSGLAVPGGIIVLHMEPLEYSLAEIARICENEDVTVSSTQCGAVGPDGKMDVMLKTNRTDLGGLVASFERHEYEVANVFGAEDGAEDLKIRYDHLMNYLNM